MLGANGTNRTRPFCEMWNFWGAKFENVVSRLQQDRHTRVKVKWWRVRVSIFVVE